MNTATATTQPSRIQQAKNSDLLIRFAEVWHTDEATQNLVPINAIVLNKNSAQATASEYCHSDQMLKMVRAACETKTVAMIRESDCSLASLTQHVGREITTVVCVPIVQKREVQGAILLGLSDVHGAVEIWGRDDRDELAIIDGHYSGLPSFEYITGYTRFPKGAGMPGGVWKSGLARVARKLDKSSAFIRSFGGDPANLSAAAALPIADSLGFPKSILLLLEAASQPLSRNTVLLSGSVSSNSAETSDDDQPPRFQIETIQPFDQSAQTRSNEKDFADTKQIEQWDRDIHSVLTINAPLLISDSHSNENPRLIWPIYSEQNLASVLIMTF